MSGQNNHWTSGNALSWALGVTLGLLAGLILLIAIPRTLGSSTAATTAAPAEAAAPAATPAPAAEPAKTEAATTEAAAPAGEPDAEAGKAKYAGTCAGCHGAEAQGAVGPALKASNAWTDAEFHTALREGKTPTKTLTAVMPKFTPDAVSDADIANIHAYLKTLN